MTDCIWIVWFEDKENARQAQWMLALNGAQKAGGEEDETAGIEPEL